MSLLMLSVNKAVNQPGSHRSRIESGSRGVWTWRLDASGTLSSGADKDGRVCSWFTLLTE